MTDTVTGDSHFGSGCHLERYCDHILGEGALWQRRFWEYNIRSSQGLNRRLDYLYCNLVRHRCIERLVVLTFSVFHRYVKPGYYEKDWGGNLAHEKLDLECGK